MGHPHSLLAFRNQIPSEGEPSSNVVALHGNRGGSVDLLQLGRAVWPSARILSPEAARGVYQGPDLVSRTWYGGSSIVRPEPASFGDSLAQIERFLLDVRDRAAGEEPALPWLLGYDQGAVLALSLAAVAPDLIAGVISICGCLPAFSDPELLAPVEMNLAVLLIGDNNDQSVPFSEVKITAARLETSGAEVTTKGIDGARLLRPNVASASIEWLSSRPDEGVSPGRCTESA